MTRKRIAGVALIGTLAIAGLGGVSSAQYEQPPGQVLTISSGPFTVIINGKATVRKRTFRIGTATCGAGSCNVLSKSARLVVRRKRKSFPASFNLNSLTGPATVPVTATITKKGLRKLRKFPVKTDKTRRGKLKYTLAIQGSGGPAVSGKGRVRLTVPTKKKK